MARHQHPDLNEIDERAGGDRVVVAPAPPPRTELVLRLQRSAGNAAVARTLQRMLKHKAASDSDDGWSDSDSEGEAPQPTVLDMLETHVNAYRSIDEGVVYYQDDPRVTNLLKFWDGTFGRVAERAIKFTDSRGRTVGELIGVIRATTGCNHRPAEAIQEIIAKQRKEDERQASEH
jgi:hypothetical protein